MSDKVISYIRTFAPIAAGAVISYLATLGLDLEGAREAIIIMLTGFFQVLYYAIARTIGGKTEAIMLGSGQKPTYKETL